VLYNSTFTSLLYLFYLFAHETTAQQPVDGMAQWQERRSWPANFPCRTLGLQLMGDHLCG